MSAILPDKSTLKGKPQNEVLAIALGAWASVRSGNPVPDNFGEVLIECAAILGIQGVASAEAFVAFSKSRA